MQVIGYKLVEFKADDDTLIKGYSVYLIGDIESKSEHAGYYSEKIFLSPQKFQDFNIKELYTHEKPFTLLYNRFGKIEKIVY